MPIFILKKMLWVLRNNYLISKKYCFSIDVQSDMTKGGFSDVLPSINLDKPKTNLSSVWKKEFFR